MPRVPEVYQHVRPIQQGLDQGEDIRAAEAGGRTLGRPGAGGVLRADQYVFLHRNSLFGIRKLAIDRVTCLKMGTVTLAPNIF